MGRLWQGLTDTFGSPVYPVALPRRRKAIEIAPPTSEQVASRPRPDGLAELRLLRGTPAPDAPAGADGLRISMSHRMTIVGTTGSGKTTAARLLLRRMQELWPHLAIYALDSKVAGDFDGWPGLHIGDRVPGLITSPDGGVQVWQPERGGLKLYDEWMQQILRGHDRTRPALVLIDELSSVAPNRDTYPDGLDLLLKQGRGKAVSLVSLTQNGVNIPANVLGMTTHLMRFRLQRDTDARRVDGLLWRDGKIREPDAAHGFHYKRLDTPADAPLVFKDARQLFG